MPAYISQFGDRLCLEVWVVATELQTNVCNFLGNVSLLILFVLTDAANQVRQGVSEQSVDVHPMLLFLLLSYSRLCCRLHSCFLPCLRKPRDVMGEFFFADARCGCRLRISEQKIVVLLKVVLVLRRLPAQTVIKQVVGGCGGGGRGSRGNGWRKERSNSEWMSVAPFRTG